jgi:hypothetical protein
MLTRSRRSFGGATPGSLSLRSAPSASSCGARWSLVSVSRHGLEHVVRANAEGAGFLCVVEPTSPVPSLELQRASGNMIAIHRARLKYVACVIEGDSMRAAIVRGVLNGMRLLVTGRIAVGFWGTVGEAAKGLSEALPIGAAEPFAECVETVRSLLPTSS